MQLQDGKHSTSICVVDDDEALNRSLCSLLREAGYAVKSFPSADMMMARIPSLLSEIDLVISDVSMPGASGYDLCVVVKKHSPDVPLPVILITGVNQGAEKAKGLELGADDFIQKPFRIEEVLAKIKSLLAQRLRQQTAHQELSSTRLENSNLTSRLQDEYERNAGLEQLRQFFSPRLAELITSHDPQSLLKRHRSEVTVLFADLRGFTAFAETSEPEEVLSVLESYYSAVGGLCLRNGGTLGHLAGDGVMAFFNDPEPVPDHRKVAVRTALQARDLLQPLRQAWQDRGYGLDFGIGLADGYATIGGIGFENFWQYTVIGTVTNLAARLCALARDGQIIVSHRLLSLTEHAFSAEPIGSLELKGIHKPIDVFNVTGEARERHDFGLTP